MLVIVAVGNKLRHKIWKAEDGETKGGVNSLLGALFGLWAFMLAFTFNQAGARFESVRVLIVDEANALRNVIYRADLFPDSVRTAYRNDLRKYLDLRISYYDHASDAVLLNKSKQELSSIAASLWARSAEQAKKPNMGILAGNMIAALSTLFDTAVKREALLNAGIPIPIVYMLVFLGLMICLVGGFTTPVIQRKEWIVINVFVFLAVMILYITFDLGRPMEGIIKPDTGQQFIVNLRKMLG
jgi:hypothetical protein